jgi:pectate lyase
MVRLTAATFIFLSLAVICSARAQDSIPAFPGAEGWGANCPGGRGGQVIHVTNLNNSGPGSLSEALNTPGPRIVVFDTSGVIQGDINFNQGNVTVLGQTAPSPGITINGMLSTSWDSTGEARYEDIVMRFIRCRPNRRATITEWADAMQFGHGYRAILDHMTFSWASDETLDIFSTKFVTVQWCTIEESDTKGHAEGSHAYGMISGPDGGPTSIHHNLFAHHQRRCPAVANGLSDIRNNVVFDFRDGFLHDNPPNAETFNIVGNFWKSGRSSSQVYPFCFMDGGNYYLKDNYIESVPLFTGMIQDPWAEKDSLPGLQSYANRGQKAELPAVVPQVTTHTPDEAYELVLNQAGCFPRDTVSRRTVDEVRNKGGMWGRDQPEDLMAGMKWVPPVVDRDRDGMADSWEGSHGLNSADSTDHTTVMASGYTAVEEYANMLAAELIGRVDGLPYKGDLDGDGKRGILDLVHLMLAVRSGSGEVSWETDVDYDGDVDFDDLLALISEL